MICPNCESPNTYYDNGEWVCLDCDYVWEPGWHPEYEEEGDEDDDDNYEEEYEDGEE